MSDPTQRPYNPQACRVEGDRIGIFIGSAYRSLTVEQARQLHAQLAAAIDTVAGEVARG